MVESIQYKMVVFRFGREPRLTKNTQQLSATLLPVFVDSCKYCVVVDHLISMYALSCYDSKRLFII